MLSLKDKGVKNIREQFFLYEGRVSRRVYFIYIPFLILSIYFLLYVTIYSYVELTDVLDMELESIYLDIMWIYFAIVIVGTPLLFLFTKIAVSFTKRRLNDIGFDAIPLPLVWGMCLMPGLNILIMLLLMIIKSAT